MLFDDEASDLGVGTLLVESAFETAWFVRAPAVLDAGSVGCTLVARLGPPKMEVLVSDTPPGAVWYVIFTAK